MSKIKKYAKGRRLEYRVKEYLEGHGLVVFRCAGSKPVDLVVLGEGKVPVLVECKSTKISKKELEEKLLLASKAGCKLVVAVPGKGWTFSPLKVSQIPYYLNGTLLPVEWIW